MSCANARRTWSWSRWVDYFRRNAATLLPIAWQHGVQLTEEERQALLPTLRELQQGEGLEGPHFRRCVHDYANQTGDLGYLEAHGVFLAEEKRHAADLARLLELAGCPLLSRPSFMSCMFQWVGSLSKLGRLEMVLATVLVGEVCLQACYGFLRKASRSRVLQQICSQILHDEMFHVRFQCETLARLRRGRLRWLLGLTHLLDQVLFFGATLACWCAYRKALRAGGATFFTFRRKVRSHQLHATLLKDPRNYAWDQKQEPVVTGPTSSGRPFLFGR